MDNSGARWIRACSVPLQVDLTAVHGYLGRRIPHRITEERGEQIVWVVEKEHVPEVAELVERWRRGEISLTSVDLPGQTSFDISSYLNRAIQIIRRLPATVLLLVCCILGALAVSYPQWFPFGFWLTIVEEGSLNRQVPLLELLTQSQWWRLMTPMFLHFGIFHIVFNGLMLWVFGARIEHALGSLHFILLVVITSAASNVAQYWWGQNPLFGGFSGVNYGFVGYVWLRQLFAPSPILAFPSGIIIFLLLWLALGVFGVIDFFIAGRIANAAHVTGLLVGVAWGCVHGLIISGRPRSPQL